MGKFCRENPQVIWRLPHLNHLNRRSCAGPQNSHWMSGILGNPPRNVRVYSWENHLKMGNQLKWSNNSSQLPGKLESFTGNQPVTSICVRPFIAEELDPRHLEAPADIPLHGMGFVQKAPEPERIEAVLWKIGSQQKMLASSRVLRHEWLGGGLCKWDQSM